MYHWNDFTLCVHSVKCLWVLTKVLTSLIYYFVVIIIIWDLNYPQKCPPDFLRNWNLSLSRCCKFLLHETIVFLTSMRFSQHQEEEEQHASGFREELPPWVKMPLFFTSKLEQDGWCHSFAVVLFDQGEWTASQESRSRAQRGEDTQLKLWRQLL